MGNEREGVLRSSAEHAQANDLATARPHRTLTRAEAVKMISAILK